MTTAWRKRLQELVASPYGPVWDKDCIKAALDEIDRLKDHGKTACDIFDELMKSQQEVRTLKLQNDALKESITVLSKEYDGRGSDPRPYRAILDEALQIGRSEKPNCKIPVDDGPCGMLHPCPRHAEKQEGGA